MRLHTLCKSVLSITLAVSLCGLMKTTSFAATNEPGAPRLSGNNISQEFYEDHLQISSTPSLRWFGSSKTKSPYTKKKYTHKSAFDNRDILHGIDVSKWQGTIDWKKVKKAGIDFAFIQVGYRGYGLAGALGISTKDPQFETNVENAIANNIKVGVYIFSQAITTKEAMEEADYILKYIGDYDITMPLIMDYEYADTPNGVGGRLKRARLSKTEATKVCMAFCDRIAEAGYTPMIYANSSMLRDQIYAEEITDAGYRIWLANYTTKTNYAGTFDFWQYASNGHVSGIKTARGALANVDMNFYYAREDEQFIPTQPLINRCSVEATPAQTFTGEAVCPEIASTYQGVLLEKDVDYTITYENNIKPGTATIVLKGLGNYVGVKRISFQILSDKIPTLKLKKKTDHSLTLSWTKDTAVTGYMIYRCSSIDGTYRRVKTVTNNSTTSFKDKDLNAGRCYYYQIQSYTSTEENTYYGELSSPISLSTDFGYTAYGTTKNDTSLYSEMNTETAVTSLPADTDFLVQYETKDAAGTLWSFVTYKTEETTLQGYLLSSDVEIIKKGKIVKSKKVNVRKKSNASSNKVTTIKKNAIVTVLSTKKKGKNLWYKVAFEKNGKNYKGYILSTYVKIQ